MSKNLNSHAQNLTQEIYDILGVRPSGAQGDKVARAIEQVIVKALTKSVERSTDAAMEICAFDSIMAHKVAENIRAAHIALIANMSALR